MYTDMDTYTYMWAYIYTYIYKSQRIGHERSDSACTHTCIYLIFISTDRYEYIHICIEAERGREGEGGEEGGDGKRGEREHEGRGKQRTRGGREVEGRVRERGGKERQGRELRRKQRS